MPKGTVSRRICQRQAGKTEGVVFFTLYGWWEKLQSIEMFNVWVKVILKK